MLCLQQPITDRITRSCRATLTSSVQAVHLFHLHGSTVETQLVHRAVFVALKIKRRRLIVFWFHVSSSSPDHHHPHHHQTEEQVVDAPLGSGHKAEARRRRRRRRSQIVSKCYNISDTTQGRGWV